MQEEIFDIKKAYREIIERNNQLNISSAIASAFTQLAWYAIYYIYLPEHRLLLFVWQFSILILTILLCVYRKKIGLNSAKCSLISILLIATLGFFIINICTAEIWIVVFLGVSMIFLGPGFLVFWPLRYFIFLVVISLILDFSFFLTLSNEGINYFLINNLFPVSLCIMIGGFLLNSRGVNVIKKERIKWSLEQSEKQLSILTQKTKEELDFLIYSISHDLRSPILSVKGLMDLINDFEKLNTDQKEYLKMAEKSVERLDQTIFDMLDFANNARIDIRSETFNMREMVQEIFDDLRFLAKVPIRFQIEIEGTELVTADKKRLKTIVKNLASNAVKYSKKDFSDAFVKFSMRQDENVIEFAISDNGRGIPKEEQDKIFEIFYRADNDSAGSGLGLFIVKEVLAKLSGTIILESTFEKGSVFKVLVPTAVRNESLALQTAIS